jgi:hypothetical protein
VGTHILCSHRRHTDGQIAATQVHSSLLSISVGALLLPAAYHFSLSGAMSPIPEVQVRDILHMSHGVSASLYITSFYPQ